jgi:hypothetical protein
MRQGWKFRVSNRIHPKRLAVNVTAPKLVNWNEAGANSYFRKELSGKRVSNEKKVRTGAERNYEKYGPPDFCVARNLEFSR